MKGKEIQTHNYSIFNFGKVKDNLRSPKSKPKTRDRRLNLFWDVAPAIGMEGGGPGKSELGQKAGQYMAL